MRVTVRNSGQDKQPLQTFLPNSCCGFWRRISIPEKICGALRNRHSAKQNNRAQTDRVPFVWIRIAGLQDAVTSSFAKGAVGGSVIFVVLEELSDSLESSRSHAQSERMLGTLRASCNRNRTLEGKQVEWTIREPKENHERGQHSTDRTVGDGL